MRNILKINIDPDRIFGLDVLRAFAILFVVIGHSFYLLPNEYSKIERYIVFDGVSIFFVLSGYLIGGIYIKLITKNEFTPGLVLNFWMRRWFRTVPNYMLILSILLVLHLIFTTNFPVQLIYKYFIFSQNLYYEHPDWFFPEAWSLTIEEWFYLLLPICTGFLILLKSSKKNAILFIIILFILLVTIFRYYRFDHLELYNGKIWDELFRKQVITRLDSLMYGVLGAYIAYFHPDSWKKYKMSLFITGILLFIGSKYLFPVIFAKTAYSAVFSFTVISIATLLLLPFLSTWKSYNGSFFRFFTVVSLISYSMYLLNLSIIQKWILNKIPFNSFIESAEIISIFKFVLYWILLFALSVICYKYFELPMTKLREKIKWKDR